MVCQTIILLRVLKTSASSAFLDLKGRTESAGSDLLLPLYFLSIFKGFDVDSFAYP
jgi:hypothetical protein